MATGGVDELEGMESEGTRLLKSSISSQTSLSGRRRIDTCFPVVTALCALFFPLLGACILSLGAVITRSHSDSRSLAGVAYIGGGTAELVLGLCLLARVLFLLMKLPRISSSDMASCLLFVALTLSFLVWCAVTFALSAAVLLNGMNYGGDWREVVAMTLSSVSLVLMLVFGVSACCWAGCPAD